MFMCHFKKWLKMITRMRTFLVNCSKKIDDFYLLSICYKFLVGLSFPGKCACILINCYTAIRISELIFEAYI